MMYLYVFAMVIVASVLFRVVYEMLTENELDHVKEYLDYEFETYINTKRSNVVRGIFREHNRKFHSDGINGPKGTA